MRYVDIPILLLLPQQIYIYPDGSYSGLMNVQNLRKPITGLANMLPLEYVDKN